MSEAIYKLQPHRTMHLQGFDAYGAAAALWGASDTGFSVSGVFRDQADFAVLVLFQKDDPFGHPRFSYLPDENFAGIKLDFDIEWTGIQAFESKKYPWMDWAYLNCYDGTGTLQQKSLLSLATGPSGRTGASVTLTSTMAETGAPANGTKVILWYQNLSFQHSAVNLTSWSTTVELQDQTLSCDEAMWWQGNAAYVHSVTIWNATTEGATPVVYSVAEGSLNSAQIAQNIAAQINASDPYCTATVGGTYGNEITVALKSSVTESIQVSSSDGSATVTLINAIWALGLALPGSTGYTYYSVTQGTLTADQIATQVAAQINAAQGDCVATASGATITLTLASGFTGQVEIDAEQAVFLGVFTPMAACTDLANQINSTDWTAHGPVALSASTATDSSGNAQLIITAEPGADGNMVTFYQQYTSVDPWFTPVTRGIPGCVQLQGGSSDSVKWHITADFSALGWTDITKLWISFAPALANSRVYAPTEWRVDVTNWTVTDGSGNRPLKVAGPGSVRIEEGDPWVAQTGYWDSLPLPSPASGDAGGSANYWSQGRAIRGATVGQTLTVETHCQATHDIYVGTMLNYNCGTVSASLDGGAPVTLDTWNGAEAEGSATIVRRKLFGGVAAGQHAVVLTITGKNANSQGWYFYFDFLECAVRGDVPDAPATVTNLGLSTDFDTDATYKLSPQRLVWNLQKLGLVGEIDHYAGVFWWNQRKASGGNYPSATVTFGGSWADQDVIWLNVGGDVSDGALSGGTSLGKTVFSTDNPSTIAAHFAAFINETMVGIWASAAGPELTITARSTGINWQYSLVLQFQSTAGTITVSGGTTQTAGGQTFISSDDLKTGAADPSWVIDPTVTPVLNRAFRDWHADYFSVLKAAGINVTASFSQELVNPPDDPGSGAVWVQRFPDGTAAETDTGFASLKSSMCAFGTAVQTYIAAAHAQMAGLMSAAGLTPRLQFGEVLWWYIAGSSGMAFYDADTVAAYGGTLHTFHTANDDPSVNGYADANFLRSRLGSYVSGLQAAILASAPTAVFELLWPLDVNDPANCRLLHYVNLPPAWQARTGSGFDRFLCEGFQYAGVDRNVDQAKVCAGYPFQVLGWDAAHCRYLEGWYNAGWPWQRELAAARSAGVPLVKFWAYDHLCLFGWPLPISQAVATSQVF